MSLSRELEVELTNVWSLLHATASGCISVAMWEGLKIAPIGDLGHWVLYMVSSIALVHAVRMHRLAVKRHLDHYKTINAVNHTVQVLEDTDPVSTPALTAEPEMDVQ